jgi:S-DNA-T family DNA segregation ATPase FtsK/SpoIIIE
MAGTRTRRGGKRRNKKGRGKGGRTTQLTASVAAFCSNAWVRQIAALLLALISLLLLLAFVSYSTADREILESGSGMVGNLTGRLGARVIRLLVIGIGWSTPLLALGLIWVAVLLWNLQSRQRIGSVLAGLALGSSAVCSMLELLFPRGITMPWPPHGGVNPAGGRWGEVLAHPLRAEIGAAGAWLVLLGLMLVALHLVFGEAWLGAIALAARGFGRLLDGVALVLVLGARAVLDLFGAVLGGLRDWWIVRRTRSADRKLARSRKRAGKRGRQAPATAHSGTERLEDEAIPATRPAQARQPTAPEIIRPAPVTLDRPERGNGMVTTYEDSLPEPTPPVAGERAPSEDGEEVMIEYELPPLSLLDEPEQREGGESEEELVLKSRLLEQKLADFSIEGRVTAVSPGPVVTCFEYAPAPGIKISKIAGLAEDLALALKSRYVLRVAPIPGKAVVGIEVANPEREIVLLSEILRTEDFVNRKRNLPVPLGKNTVGQPVISDLTQMPHLLIAGATGSGKSVCINAILTSLLLYHTPYDLRLLLIDPKMLELNDFDGIQHLREPVVKDARMAPEALNWAVAEMERRYRLLAGMGVRNLKQYNNALATRPPEERPPGYRHAERLPYLVIVIDELADLMMVSARQVEDSIVRLVQMARAAGIHVVLATQRPSVDVITGLIKANMPCRIAFQVSSKVDSRTIIDQNGAETLLGKGDMLFMPPGTSKLMRLHGAFVSEQEVKAVVKFWRDQPPFRSEPSIFGSDDEPGELEGGLSGDDDLYEEAVKLVVQSRIASISLLQRRLRIGHARAARLMDMMEQDGIVGPHVGSKPREILKEMEDLPEIQWESRG